MGILSSFTLLKRTNSLSLRLLLYVIICSSFFTLLATVSQLYFDYKRDLNELQSNLQFIESSYVPSISRSLYFLDDEQLRLELKGALKLQDIAYLSIKEHRGNGEFKIFEGDPDTIDIIKVLPLLYKKKSGESISLGFLTVKASFKGVYGRLWNKFFIILISNAVKTFIASFFIFSIFHMMISRHLIKIAKFTKQMNFDGSETDLKLYRKKAHSPVPDELEIVTIALNDMQFRLKNEIDKLKQSEETLRRSEAKLNAFFNHSPMGLLIWDASDPVRYLAINETLARINGRPVEEHIGKTIAEVFPDSKVAREHDTLLRDLIKTKQAITFDSGGLSVDGRQVYYIAQYFPILGTDNKPVAIGGAVLDITDRKVAELALEDYKEKLEEKVRERTSDLRKIIDAMAGREIRMRELKKEIEVLRGNLRKAGMDPALNKAVLAKNDNH